MKGPKRQRKTWILAWCLDGGLSVDEQIEHLVALADVFDELAKRRPRTRAVEIVPAINFDAEVRQ